MTKVGDSSVSGSSANCHQEPWVPKADDCSAFFQCRHPELLKRIEMLVNRMKSWPSSKQF